MRKLALIISMFLSGHLLAQEYQVKLEPAKGKFKEVEYYLWIPENIQNIKGIILHQHGCGESAFRSGQNAFYDLQWRALAKKYDFALMGSSYVSTTDCHDWVEPEEGSYDTFVKGISEIARQSKHSELEQVPWVIWGHSGGGHWAYKMVLEHPDKLLCAVLKSPAWTDTSSVGLQVPVLCLLGIQESYTIFSDFIWASAMAAMKYRIRKNGPDCIAIDPTASHESANSRLLAISFIDEILKHRSADRTTQINRGDQCFIDLDNFKLSNNLTQKYYTNKGNWFPDKLFAENWSAFVKTGSVTDQTPPVASPYHVEGRKVGRSNRIDWNCFADLESGIQGFKVYRNDQVINQDSIESKWNFKIDYHDNPIVIYPKFEFVDTKPDQQGVNKYQVSMINQAGLESPKSKAIFMKP